MTFIDEIHINLSTESIAEEVRAARMRAHVKHGANSIEGIAADDPRWLSILVEEVGEASHELTYDATGSLRAELIDIITVATAWVASLDRASIHEQVCDVCGDEYAYCDGSRHGSADPVHPPMPVGHIRACGCPECVAWLEAHEPADPVRCPKCGGPDPFHDPACVVHPDLIQDRVIRHERRSDSRGRYRRAGADGEDQASEE